MSQEKRPIRCQHCGHEWNTSSLNRYTNCPKCMYKVLNPHFLNVPVEIVLSHFNLDAEGVRILDKSLRSKNSPNGRIVDIYFKDKKVWCEYHDSFDCNHIEYALSIPMVQALLKKKGWKV